MVAEPPVRPELVEWLQLAMIPKGMFAAQPWLDGLTISGVRQAAT